MSLELSEENNPLDAPPTPGLTGILVVDEDPAFQLGLKTFLREYVGFENVFTARSGAEAIDFIEAEPSIEMVTLDQHMPEMTGIEVLHELTAIATRPLSVMMITGSRSADLEAEFRSMGTAQILTNHFITKPIEFERLEPIVIQSYEELLEAKRPKVIEEPEAALPFEPEITISRMNDKLDEHSHKLDEINTRLEAVQRRQKWGIWKLLVVAAIIWIASQFGLFKSMEPGWNKVKETVRASFSPRTAPAAGAASPAPIEKTTAPAESAPAAPEAKGKAAEAPESPPEGRPL
ncbi:MAG: response regulator [Verrucomicrobiales bacterium]|nr:response regulator [Verrucomicrobiales bacterium]